LEGFFLVGLLGDVSAAAPACLGRPWHCSSGAMDFSKQAFRRVTLIFLTYRFFDFWLFYLDGIDDSGYAAAKREIAPSFDTGILAVEFYIWKSR
jgi:hypothetical protein